MTKQKLYSRHEALAVARSLVHMLSPVSVERIEIAGSLRREVSKVHDIEIVLVPKFVDTKEDMFNQTLANLADKALNELLAGGVLEHRPNVNGDTCWGDLNKMAIHSDTGIPVDFFACSRVNWWNSLVVRTGGKQTNIEISKAALDRGWSFEAGGAGFHKTKDRNERHDSSSEKDVFSFAGLDYLEPRDRK